MVKRFLGGWMLLAAGRQLAKTVYVEALCCAGCKSVSLASINNVSGIMRVGE